MVKKICITSLKGRFFHKVSAKQGKGEQNIVPHGDFAPVNPLFAPLFPKVDF
jgi:hypothetical protein